MSETTQEISTELALETIISNAVKLPLVKVDRKSFLAESFANSTFSITDILEQGPIAAGVTQEELNRLARKLILKRTSQSSAASFVTGIPGGLAMAATVPADVLQFFGMALRLAQELSYLYGAEDLWQDGTVSDERIQSQLILYCGVMFGVSGAVSGVRVLSTQIAKTTLKKLPQKALSKTFWYPIVKQIGKAIGVKVTKTTVAQGISKAVPLIGGVISGSLNFASMMPMANRLHEALEKASFNYTDEDLAKDLQTLESIDQMDVGTSPANEKNNLVQMKGKVTQGLKSMGAGLAGAFGKKKGQPTQQEPTFDAAGKIEQLFRLKEIGAISQEEFEAKKAELMAKI